MRYSTLFSNRRLWSSCHLERIALVASVRLIAALVLLPGSSGQFLQGEPAYCSGESSLLAIPLITTNPCINCRCERFQVVCERRTCPYTPTSCYFHLQTDGNGTKNDDCCTHCKGCEYQGRFYRNGAEWNSESDPCQAFYCRDGIVTKTSKRVCYSPCSNPVPVPGSCCPVCKGCFANGKIYKEGEEIQVPDPCVRCVCNGGNLICDKIACPVLACPINLYMHERPGSCCPTCHGFRPLLAPGSSIQNDKHCMVGTRIVKNDQQVTVDSCTTCVCNRSTLICKRQVCPILTCPPEFQQRTSSDCCATCLPDAPLYCETEEATYTNGETWKLDSCVTCRCDDGHVKCSVLECPASTRCLENEVPYKEKGECCEKCVPKNAVCTVYGDPHYRTFDGMSYSFQGRCKYVAVEDCYRKDKRFSVILRNDARKSAHFTWTKSVHIQLDRTKIALQQNLKVQVDKRTVRLPVVRLGNYSIMTRGQSVEVRSNYGLRVLWDGDSYVEITLPVMLRNQVCGLCGNYNGNASDDLTIRNTAAITDDVNDFALSWQVVGKRTPHNKCLLDEEPMVNHEPKSRSARNIPCQGHSLKKGLKVLRNCRVFKSTVLRTCRRLVDPTPYHQSCLEDLCECPRNRACLCQSLTAFLRECERHGGSVRNVRETHCRSL